MEPHTMSAQQAMTFAVDAMAEAVETIHHGTAIYTAVPEIEALLDRLGWPDRGTALLDPGAGNGGFLVAALDRIELARNDADGACAAVHGYEFHPGAAAAARRAVTEHLTGRGWNPATARGAAERIVEIRDFLLSPVPVAKWDVIAANPPYWRYANLPPEYRFEYDVKVEAHARADLLYAYLQRAADIVKPGGRIGLITADRWLLNSGSAELRERIGARYAVEDVRRLKSHSAFYRPKARTRGTPARVHPVALVLSPEGNGRPLGRSAFMIEDLPEVQGRPLSEIATVRLAPWLGPDGIFVVRETAGLPPERMIPCYEPEDCGQGDDLPEPKRWAIATDRSEPEESVLRHLDARLGAMPKRGRQNIRWLPPEPFFGRLPLDVDAVLVPRISKNIRAIRLPAGSMPVNHNIVVVSGLPVERLRTILTDPRVQAQADALALRLEGGYRSYTTTLLRQLVVPEDLLT
jgi:methylase of polypeptide subunit release factors